MSMKDFKNQLSREISTMKFTRTTFKDYFIIILGVTIQAFAMLRAFPSLFFAITVIQDFQTTLLPFDLKNLVLQTALDIQVAEP